MAVDVVTDEPASWLCEAGKLVVRGSFKRTAIEQLADVHLPSDIVGPEVEVNLGQLTGIDTAGLALLVSWQSEARARGVHLSYTHAPRAMAAMMQAYGLEGLLDVTERRR